MISVGLHIHQRKAQTSIRSPTLLFHASPTDFDLLLGPHKNDKSRLWYHTRYHVSTKKLKLIVESLKQVYKAQQLPEIKNPIIWFPNFWKLSMPKRLSFFHHCLLLLPKHNSIASYYRETTWFFARFTSGVVLRNPARAIMKSSHQYHR